MHWCNRTIVKALKTTIERKKNSLDNNETNPDICSLMMECKGSKSENTNQLSNSTEKRAGNKLKA